MTLRPLLELASADETFRVLAAAAMQGEGTEAHASGAIQPYLIAALADDPDALGGAPVVVVAVSYTHLTLPTTPYV